MRKMAGKKKKLPSKIMFRIFYKRKSGAVAPFWFNSNKGRKKGHFLKEMLGEGGGGVGEAGKGFNRKQEIEQRNETVLSPISKFEKKKRKQIKKKDRFF